MDALLARDAGGARPTPIRRGCEIKAAIVAEDEREQGGARAAEPGPHLRPRDRDRRPGYGELLHGEAVAVGTVLAADLSARLGWMPAAKRARADACCRRAGPAGRPRRGIDADARARAAWRWTRRSTGGQMRLVLLAGIGRRRSPRDFAAARRSQAARGERRMTASRAAEPRALRRARAAARAAGVTRSRRRLARRVPARSRPHHPLDRVSPARLQDPGLRQPRRRPVPHAAHALARSRADRAHGRARAAPERRPGRSDLPGARPRPHAVRPRRPGRAERLHARATAASSTTCSRCASSTSSKNATPSFRGLNLTFETREGILKHCSLRERARSSATSGERFLERRQPGLEAQLANLADEIAYNNHDVDDGLRSGLLTLEQLRDVPLFAATRRRDCAYGAAGRPPPDARDDPAHDQRRS